MKKILLSLFVLLLGCALTSWSEDLGELAKKEKARRRAIEKEGKQSRAFTNADIPNLKATLALEVKDEPESEGDEEGLETAAAESVEEADTYAEEPYSAPEEETTDTDSKIRNLEQEKEKLEQEIGQARETMDTGGAMVRNYGSQMQQSREAEERIAEIDKEIDKLQEEEEEEGEEGSE